MLASADQQIATRSIAVGKKVDDIPASLSDSTVVFSAAHFGGGHQLVLSAYALTFDKSGELQGRATTIAFRPTVKSIQNVRAGGSTVLESKELAIHYIAVELHSDSRMQP